MGIHVIGIKPPDEKWKKMAYAYRACEAAGVPIPSEIEKFFEGAPPDPAGVAVSLTDDAVCQRDCDGYDSIDINLSELPADVTVVRVDVHY